MDNQYFFEYPDQRGIQNGDEALRIEILHLYGLLALYRVCLSRPEAIASEDCT